MQQQDLFDTQRALTKRWEIVPVSDQPEDLNWELLLEALEERITYLFEHNLEKLLSSLYLLDISEQRSEQAMSQPTLKAKARALAEAILDRESEKILTRKKYAGKRRDLLP